MPITFDRVLLGELSAVVAERLGLHFPEDRWSDLARGFESAGKELGFGDPTACERWLRSRELTERQIETVASHLTVGETYFFRDQSSFDALEREVLPALKADRDREGRCLRMWSAGCCTGEEPYSLAISCRRIIDEPDRWNISILGTDINPKFLAKAESGVYGEWSFRGTAPWVRQTYFTPAARGTFAIHPTIKARVRFAYLNLAEDVFPSLNTHTNAMDVIFCRNVLMYFTPDHQRRVVAALHRSLVEGGYLFVNPAEGSQSLFSKFALKRFGDAFCYCKRSAAAEDVVPVQAYVPDIRPKIETPSVHPGGAEPTAAMPAPPPTEARGDFLNVARACADAGQLGDALDACRQAIALDKTNPAAYFLYATICHELNQVDDALGALEKVLYLDQDFILAHHALGGMFRRLDRKRESRRHYGIARQLLSARPQDDIVPESGGMTCGRLLDAVNAMTEV